MPAISHIVVPVDFGEASDAALAYAKMLASHFNASLTVVHVHDDVLARAAFAPEVYGTVPTDARERALRDLHVRLTALIRPGDVQRGASVEVLHGPTSRAIVEYAAQCGASLIVMGTHGRKGLAHAVLGSVAEQVLRSAPCPVLAVRQTPEPASLKAATRLAEAG
jgi:nucleotide-binding universal stress UspA family protein